jgi:hypothetical protein
MLNCECLPRHPPSDAGSGKRDEDGGVRAVEADRGPKKPEDLRRAVLGARRWAGVARQIGPGHGPRRQCQDRTCIGQTAVHDATRMMSVPDRLGPDNTRSTAICPSVFLVCLASLPLDCWREADKERTKTPSAEFSSSSPDSVKEGSSRPSLAREEFSAIAEVPLDSLPPGLLSGEKKHVVFGRRGSCPVSRRPRNDGSVDCGATSGRAETSCRAHVFAEAILRCTRRARRGNALDV